MTENLSVKQNVSNQRKLERVAEKKYKSFETAKANQQAALSASPAPAKVKIFARYDGTFDVVTYQKIKSAEEKAFEKKVEKVGEEIKKGGPRRSAVMKVLKDKKKSQ
jgi:hypothetical protein